MFAYGEPVGFKPRLRRLRLLEEECANRGYKPKDLGTFKDATDLEKLENGEQPVFHVREFAKSYPALDEHRKACTRPLKS